MANKNQFQNRDGLPDLIVEEKRFFSLNGLGKNDTPKGWNNPANWEYLDNIPEDNAFGFAIGNNSDYLLIDFDHVINPETKELIPWVEEVYQRITQYCNTYYEISMSGTGMHMIVDLGEYADNYEPESNGPEQIIINMNSKEYNMLSKEEQGKIPKIELFFHTNGRYVYLTGKHNKLYQVAQNEDAVEIFNELLKARKEFHKKHSSNNSKDQAERFKHTNEDKETVLRSLPYISANNYDVWIKVGQALYNCGFDFEIWNNWSKYTDQKNEVLCSKYNPEETPKKWKSFRNTQSHWNVGTIVLLAKENPEYSNVKSSINDSAKGNSGTPSDILKATIKMADVTEKETDWLFPNYFPRKQIVVLASEGGTGKGIITASLVAALTRGEAPCFMQKNTTEIKCGSVLYLTSEDPAEEVLHKRFRKAGADLNKIITIGTNSDMLAQISFTDENKYLKTLLDHYRPALTVFDPIQSFIPDNVHMSERNQMRRCMSKLTTYGSQFGTTFLILAHTNKRDGASGRKRIADSADIWDIARSVLVAGSTGTDDLKYLSHEKSNMGPLQRTVLFKIDEDGRFVFSGTTDKKDRDYVEAKISTTQRAPKNSQAKECIIEALTNARDNQMNSKKLDELCIIAGHTKSTLNRAKRELKNEGMIKYKQTGFGDNKQWSTQLVK